MIKNFGSSGKSADVSALAKASVLGALADAAATGPVTTSDTLMAYVKQLVTEGAGGEAGLALLAQVTGATSTTVFASTTLIGYGDDAFPAGYECYILQADNAAPEGEAQLVTDFVDATGTVTVGTAFTAAPSVGDWIMILHPSIAALGNKTDSAAAGAVTTTDSIVAYVKQLVTSSIIARHTMQFESPVQAIVVVTDTAADLDFPSVVVSGLPSGCTIDEVKAIIVVGGTFDTSSAENQLAVADGKVRVKKAAGAWGTDDLDAVDMVSNTLQTAADAYGSGSPFFGDSDIKAEVDGDATYNFRSEETNGGDAIEATGSNLELHNVTSILRVTFH